MAYFIYNRQTNNQIYKIAENDLDLSSLIFTPDQYLVVNATQDDFNQTRLNNKYILNYDGTSNRLANTNIKCTREDLQNYLNIFNIQITDFLTNNPNNIKYSQWSNYKSYLNTLNVNVIIPQKDGWLNSSLEVYIESLGQPSLNSLQLP
jgi:hypothetical protein